MRFLHYSSVYKPHGIKLFVDNCVLLDKIGLMCSNSSELEGTTHGERSKIERIQLSTARREGGRAKSGRIGFWILDCGCSQTGGGGVDEMMTCGVCHLYETGDCHCNPPFRMLLQAAYVRHVCWAPPFFSAPVANLLCPLTLTRSLPLRLPPSSVETLQLPHL